VVRSASSLSQLVTVAISPLRRVASARDPSKPSSRLCKSSGSTDSTGCPLVSVRAPTFAVTRTRPRVEGETFRRNPGLMRWSRLENV
jgi:hypothetical protein